MGVWGGGGAGAGLRPVVWCGFLTPRPRPRPPSALRAPQGLSARPSPTGQPSVPHPLLAAQDDMQHLQDLLPHAGAAQRPPSALDSTTQPTQPLGGGQRGSKSGALQPLPPLPPAIALDPFALATATAVAAASRAEGEEGSRRSGQGSRVSKQSSGASTWPASADRLKALSHPSSQMDTRPASPDWVPGRGSAAQRGSWVGSQNRGQAQGSSSPDRAALQAIVRGAAARTLGVDPPPACYPHPGIQPSASVAWGHISAPHASSSPTDLSPALSGEYPPLLGMHGLAPSPLSHSPSLPAQLGFSHSGLPVWAAGGQTAWHQAAEPAQGYWVQGNPGEGPALRAPNPLNAFAGTWEQLPYRPEPINAVPHQISHPMQSQPPTAWANVGDLAPYPSVRLPGAYLTSTGALPPPSPGLRHVLALSADGAPHPMHQLYSSPSSSANLGGGGDSQGSSYAPATPPHPGKYAVLPTAWGAQGEPIQQALPSRTPSLTHYPQPDPLGIRGVGFSLQQQRSAAARYGGQPQLGAGRGPLVGRAAGVGRGGVGSDSRKWG